MIRRLVPYAVAGCAALVPAYAFAQDDAANSGEDVTEVQGEQPQTAADQGTVPDQQAPAAGQQAAPDLQDTPQVDAPAQDTTTDELVGPGGRDLILVPEGGDININIYEELKMRIEDGPLGLLDASLKDEWTKLTIQKETAEGKCGEYINFMKTVDTLPEEIMTQVVRISEDRQLPMYDRALTIRGLQIPHDTVQHVQSGMGELYLQCALANEIYADRLVEMKERIPANLFESEDAKRDRARTVANEVVEPVRERVSILEAREDLSLRVAAGAESHDTMAGVVDATLCYGTRGKVCLQGGVFVGDDEVTTSVSSSDTKEPKVVGDGLLEELTIENEIEESNRHRAYVGLRGATPDYGLNATGSLTLQVGASASLYLGSEVVETTTTAHSQLQTAAGENVGGERVVPDEGTPERDSRLLLVPMIDAELCYKSACLDLGVGIDPSRVEEDGLKKSGILRVTLGYEF